MKLKALLMPLLLCGLFVGACSSSSDETPAADTAATPAVTTPEPAPATPPATPAPGDTAHADTAGDTAKH